MIDAEQTFIQYGIDSITRQLQRLYNKDKVMIMNTYQSSLKRTQRNVCLDVLGCDMLKVPFGAKLVRGAYVTEENKLALDQEVESPVFPNKALVDKSYNETMLFVLQHMPPCSHFNVASHNDTSVEIAEEEVMRRKKDFEKNNIQVSFAQLKGLSDKMTFGLAQRGHYTFKYLPYGPTNFLVPYLFRRAEEASYIWVEGQKKLEDVRHELFDVRKVHYKAGVILAGALILFAII
eukprot:TRINITY_DN3456_c0_g1_i19.p1 TRINITY_DN3456_c0_g1~~TRINITY_DN3456_c0_g1_i19.p1  ORF type:complete len:234 (-),score=98.39 TRINITY_DN3456_c0_g1_i19:171-872(-)